MMQRELADLFLVCLEKYDPCQIFVFELKEGDKKRCTDDHVFDVLLYAFFSSRTFSL